MKAKMKAFLPAALIFVALTVLYTLLSACHWSAWTFCDETDSYAAAMVIADGGALYRDYITQHMPGMHYLCALFRVLGADSILDYRVAFFFCMAMLWAGMYIRYRKWYGRTLLLLYPVGYLGLMALYGLHSSVPLSEHVAAQGIAVLLMEMLHFLTTRKLDGKSILWIGAGVALSFCFLFISAFQIAVVALCVAAAWLCALIWRRETDEKPLRQVKKAGWVVVSCALPVAVMTVLFAAFGCFDAFFDQIYTFNRKVYSVYCGFGGDTFSSVLNAVTLFVNYLTSAVDLAKGGDWLGWVYAATILLGLWSAMAIGRKTPLGGIAYLLLLFFGGMRAYDSFHSISYYSLTLLGTLIALHMEAGNVHRATPVAVGALLLIMMVPYMRQVPRYYQWNTWAESRDIGAAIHNITDEDDRIVVLNLEWGLCVESDRTPLCMGVASLPWYNDRYGYNERRFIVESEPKVIVCDRDMNVWGYDFKDYSLKMLIFVNSKYTPLSDAYPTVLVRNDYLEEARARLAM